MFERNAGDTIGGIMNCRLKQCYKQLSIKMIYKSGVGEEENSEKESRLEAFCKLAHNKHTSSSHTHNMNKKDYHTIVSSLVLMMVGGMNGDGWFKESMRGFGV